MRGIDISNWQAGISPSAMPIDFCICKATEGLGFVDQCCDGWITELSNASMLWGFYHFARENEPEDEAQFFYDNCRGYFNRGIPVLDYETQNYNNCEWCERFLSKLHELSGIWAMLYISASRCGEYENSWIPDTCGLWVAGYPWDNPYWTEQSMPYNIYPWPFAAIWQFTSGLYLDGWDGRLDGDVAYMDVEAWKKYACIDDIPLPQPTPPQPTPVKSTDDLAYEVILGEYGNDEERKRLLGDRYNEVQNRVNELYSVAEQVINGDWGNGSERQVRLTSAGYPYEAVQRIVNDLLGV